VLSSARVRVVEQNGGAQLAREEERAANSAGWRGGGVRRELINLGPNPYRELSVQIK
jgi:hypothetical protein